MCYSRACPHCGCVTRSAWDAFAGCERVWVYFVHMYFPAMNNYAGVNLQPCWLKHASHSVPPAVCHPYTNSTCVLPHSQPKPTCETKRESLGRSQDDPSSFTNCVMTDGKLPRDGRRWNAKYGRYVEYCAALCGDTDTTTAFCQAKRPRRAATPFPIRTLDLDFFFLNPSTFCFQTEKNTWNATNQNITHRCC